MKHFLTFLIALIALPVMAQTASSTYYTQPGQPGARRDLQPHQWVHPLRCDPSDLYRHQRQNMGQRAVVCSMRPRRRSTRAF